MNKDTLAFLVYCNRLDTDLTQEIFAGDANISRSALVRIEQGLIKNVDDTNLGNVLNLIGTTVDEIEQLDNKLGSLLHTLFTGLITDNISISRTLTETDELCAEHRYVVGDINYLLIKYIYCFQKSKTVLFDKIDSVLVEAIDFMTRDQLAIYYDIKGLYLKQNKQYQLAKNQFLMAQSYSDNDYYKSIVTFHLGKTLISMDDYFGGMEAYNQATELFSKTLNYQKLLYTKMDIAAIYMKIGNYEKALETYQLVLDSAFSLNANNILIASIKRNMSAIYMYKGDYETSISIAESSFGYDKECSIAYFQIAFSFYMMNDMIKAKYWISQAEDNCIDTTSIEMKMLRLLKKIILKKKDAIDSLVSFLEKNSFEGNKRYKTIIQYLIIEYYLYEENNVVKANEYYTYLGQSLSSIKIFDKLLKEKG